MKSKKFKIELTLFGTPESFQLTCTALEASIRAVREKESKMVNKPSCYSSPVPLLEKVLHLYQDIFELSIRKQEPRPSSVKK